MAKLNISLNEVSAIAQSLKVRNQSLDETLAFISRTMNEIEQEWMSNSSTAIVANFNHFARAFIDESETIREYARFLEEIVSTYDSLESTLTANAENVVY